MKKSMLLIGLLISLFAQGQLNLMPSIGINDRTHFIAALGFMYEVKQTVQITAEEIAIMHNTEPAYFGGRVGGAIHITANISLVPAAGCYFKAQSFDKNEFTKGQNEWTPGYFLKLQSRIAFVEGSYIKDFQIRLGAKVKL